MCPELDFTHSSGVGDFPVALWEQTRATFVPIGAELPESAPVAAALVFVMQGERFVVADIAGRGWCIPGGRLEPGETPEEAARREAREEVGATLGLLTLLGHYVLTDTTSGSVQLVPTYRAEALALDALPPETESQGVCLMALAELPGRYFRWDALLEAVFEWAVSGIDQTSP